MRMVCAHRHEDTISAIDAPIALLDKLIPRSAPIAEARYRTFLYVMPPGRSRENACGILRFLWAPGGAGRWFFSHAPGRFYCVASGFPPPYTRWALFCYPREISVRS